MEEEEEAAAKQKAEEYKRTRQEAERKIAEERTRQKEEQAAHKRVELQKQELKTKFAAKEVEETKMNTLEPTSKMEEVQKQQKFAREVKHQLTPLQQELEKISERRRAVEGENTAQDTVAKKEQGGQEKMTPFEKEMATRLKREAAKGDLTHKVFTPEIIAKTQRATEIAADDDTNMNAEHQSKEQEEAAPKQKAEEYKRIRQEAEQKIGEERMQHKEEKAAARSKYLCHKARGG